MPGLIEKQLRSLGIDLPAAPKAVGAYVTVIRTGNLVITSGQLPWKDGKLLYCGRLGIEISVDQGYAAARQCALNAIAQFQSALGDLDLVCRIVRVEEYVHCAEDFRGHPQVLDGASDLLNQVFGEKGRHTRTALGIHAMPLDAPIQLIVWAEVE